MTDAGPIADLPLRVLSQYRLHLQPMRAAHKPDGTLKAFGPEHLLPPLHTVEHLPHLADFYAGWRPEGLSIGIACLSWNGRFDCDPKRYWNTDGVRIFLDTRDTRDVARASKFCQQFYVLPSGGGASGTEPVVGRGRIMRAKEEPPPVNLQLIKVAVGRDAPRRRYQLDMFFPAEVLHGYDPSQFDRLGLFFSFINGPQGGQELTAGKDLEFWGNPSLWASAVLCRQ